MKQQKPQQQKIINCLLYMDKLVLKNFLSEYRKETHHGCLSKIVKETNYFYFQFHANTLKFYLQKEGQDEYKYLGQEYSKTFHFDYENIVRIYFDGYYNENINFDYYFSSKEEYEKINNKENLDITILRGAKRQCLFSFEDSFYQKNQKDLKDEYLTFVKNDKKMNYIPPYAFLSKKKHNLIILESILNTIKIKEIQNLYSKIQNPHLLQKHEKKQQQQNQLLHSIPNPLFHIKCVIVTHNSQLQCFLQKFFNVKFDGRKRFKNQCVLKLVIEKTKSSISLFSEGVIHNPKHGTYFGQREDVRKEGVIYEKFVKQETETKEMIDWNILGCNLEIYLIRHGEAYHNIRSLNLAFDTKLTQKGKQNKIQDQKQKKICNVDYYFTSSLLRTRETLKIICPDIKDLIILPCAQEIVYYNQNCYEKNENRILPNAPENIRSWFRSSLPSDMNIDWKFYDNNSCPVGSNMIEEMVQIIFYEKLHSYKSSLCYSYLYELQELNETKLNELEDLSNSTVQKSQTLKTIVEKLNSSKTLEYVYGKEGFITSLKKQLTTIDQTSLEKNVNLLIEMGNFLNKYTIKYIDNINLNNWYLNIFFENFKNCKEMIKNEKDIKDIKDFMDQYFNVCKDIMNTIDYEKLNKYLTIIQQTNMNKNTLNNILERKFIGWSF
jgi:broad specificity phosphatase PhoE